MEEKNESKKYSNSEENDAAENMSEEKTSEDNDRLDYIMKSGGVVSKTQDETIQCLTIIGQIEGHYNLGDGQKATKYEHIIPLLLSIEESDEIDGLLVVLNTMGGDVEAGLAIAEMLAGMKTPTVSIILGGGHSIGLPIAVACKKSFAVPSATLTIHPVRISGTVLGVPQAFASLEKMQERVSGFIVGHSRIKRDVLDGLMMNTGELTTDVGSVISGEEAIKIGLIDELGGIADAFSAVRSMAEKKLK